MPRPDIIRYQPSGVKSYGRALPPGWYVSRWSETISVDGMPDFLHIYNLLGPYETEEAARAA